MRKLGPLLALVIAWSLASAAQADRVVLLHAMGDDASESLLERVDQALLGAVRAVGHEPLTDHLAWEAPKDVPPPRTANELRAVAELQNADWALVPKVRAAEGGYWLTLRVGYGPEMRVELISAEVRDSREAERLREILAAVLRPEGAGADAPRISGKDDAARELEAQRARKPDEPDAEAARDQEEQDEQARRDFEAREQERAEAERARQEQEARERWESRERYGDKGPWLVQAGLGMRPLVSRPEGGQGGVLGALELRGGHVFDAVPGLEVRGGVDIVFGAANAFAMYVGAAYLGSYFAGLPLFLGPSLELGFLHPLTGARTTSFMLRAGPVVSWRPVGPLYLEATALEVMWLTAGGGAVTLGFSARAGVRF
jgi:hypothetical protein